MQTLYASSRRMVASLLIAVLTVYALLTVLRDLDTSGALDTGAIVVIATAVLAAALLAVVAAQSAPRFGFDMVAFLLAAIAVAVSWGAAALEPGFLIYLPAVIVAIAFATMALMLRTEAGAAVTKDRL